MSNDFIPNNFEIIWLSVLYYTFFILLFLFLAKYSVKDRSVWFDERGIYVRKYKKFQPFSEIVSIKYDWSGRSCSPNSKSKISKVKIRLKSGRKINFTRQYDDYHIV